MIPVPAVLASPAIRYGAVALAAGLCVAQVQAWRYDGYMAMERLAAANLVIEARDQSAKLANQLHDADLKAVQKLTEAQDENDALRSRVAAGTTRLRIQATCPAPSATASSVGDGQTAELSAEAGQAALDIRAGILKLEAAHDALIEYAKNVSGT